MNEVQEIHCHNCGMYVQFPIDPSLNGNHVLACPVCGHEHCRVVRDGVITSDRWDSRNGQTFHVLSGITFSQVSTTTTSSSSGFLADSWMMTSSSTSGNVYY